MTEFTDQSLLDMGYSTGEVTAYRMKQNRELSGIAPKIDLDNDAGKMSAEPEHDYETIVPLQKSGVAPVEIDGKSAVVNFDAPPVNDGTTPYPKHEIVFPDGTRKQRQLASNAQSVAWEEREGAQDRYEALRGMEPDEAQERILEIFEGNEDAISVISVGIATDQDFDTVRQAMSQINTNTELKNSDVEMMADEDTPSMKRVDVVGWEDGEPVFSETPKYAPIDDDAYIEALSTNAMVFTGKEHYVKDGKIVEGKGDLIDLSFDEMRKLAYQSSILGKVGLIEDCATDKSKCSAMVQDFYKKAESLHDQAWYERLATSASTFGLDFPFYSSSCMLGGGIAAGAATPAATAATAAGGPMAGGAVEASAFTTGCWTLSLATHGSITSVLDDILESLVNDTELDGVDVFIGAVQEFGAQAVIGFLTAKIGGGAKSLSEMIPGLTKMSRGIAAPTVEFVAQGATLAQGQHLWQRAQGNVPGWVVDRQALTDSVIFLGSFKLMHAMTASARRKVKGKLNTSEKYIQHRLIKIQKKYGIPHEVIVRYVETHPTLAREIVDQLAEAPHIVDGKEVFMLPYMIREMLLSISAHHAKSTSRFETDGQVTTLSTNKLEEIGGKIVRKYIVLQSGTEAGEAVNRRSEVIFEQMGNGQLKLVGVKGTVDPAKIAEIIKNDGRSVIEVAEGIEGFKAEKVKPEEELSDIDTAVLATRLEINDLVQAVDKLSPETAKQVREILSNAAEGVFGKEQIIESIGRLEEAAKIEIRRAGEEATRVKRESSEKQRAETGFHTIEYLNALGVIEDIGKPVVRIEAPDMKVVREGELGEHYFLAEHASDNPNLANMEKGFNAILHVGDNAQVGEIISRKSHRTPYKVLVKVNSPLADKRGNIVHEESKLGDAESPEAIATALVRMEVFDIADATRIKRSDNPNAELMEVLRDHDIDSIFYRNVGEEKGGISAIIVPENAKVLHKIKKGTGLEDTVEGRNYNHSDPEFGAVDLSLPDIVAIAEGVLSGDMPTVARYLGEGVRGMASIRKKTDDIKILAELGKDPEQLRKTLAHEIGHIVDSTLRHELLTGQKTNIIGRLIALKGHIDAYHEGRPHGEKPLTSTERRDLKKKARRLLEEELDALSQDKDIQSELGITPQQIKDIFTGVVGRAEADPAIYEFIAGLSRQRKKEILRVLAHKKIPAEIQAIVDRGRESGQEQRITDEQVARKYEELFMAEVYRRGLLVKDEIHQELYNLSKEWRPFDEESVSAEYQRYRESSAELYADFMSAFMVNPVLAERIAPKSYAGFMEFIDNNQRFKTNYNKIQDEIAVHGSSNAAVRKRVRGGFERGAKIRADQSKDARLSDHMAWALVDEAHGIIRGVKFAKKKGVTVSAADHPMYKYRDWLYRNSIAELYLDTIGSRIMSPARMKGVTAIEFGEYLLYQRIGRGDRQDLINTYGIDFKTAVELLRELDIRHPHLRDLVDEYWMLRQQTILEFVENTDAIDPTLKQKILENKYYATVNVVDHIEQHNGKGSGLTMFGQIGTFKAQENPLLATIENDMILIAGLLKNEAKRSAVDNLVRVKREVEGEIPREAFIQKADTEMLVLDNGVKIRRPIEPKDPEMGLITVMRDGKIKGYYVDKFTALAFRNNPTELVKVLQSASRVNNYFREVYTIANPGFILATNPLRDIHRLVLNMPDRKRDMIPYYKDVSMFLQTLTYGVPEGIARVRGKGSARVDKMRKEMSLISVSEPWGEHEGKDPLSGLLHRFHGADSRQWNEIVKHPFDTLMRRVHDLNAVMETSTKVVADRHLEKYFPDIPAGDRVNIIRTQGGSPAHLVRGGGAVVYNNLFLFSNAMKEGYRGDWEAAKGRYGEWSYHAIMSGVVPKVLMFAMAQGYVMKGQTLEDAKINATIMSMVPERVKANYIVIPLGLRTAGENEDGSPIYKARVLVKPVDETSRLLGGITHKLLQQQFGVTSNQRDGALSYMGGEVPAFTPAIELIQNTFDYFVNNENPIDSYSGRPIIGEDKFKAKMGDAEFYNWLWKNLGGSIFLKDNPLVDLTSPTDIVPKDKEIPILSGISNRLIKEYDSRDLPFAIGDEIEVQKARQRVTLESAIIKGMTLQELNDDEIKAISTIEGRELKRKIEAIVRKGTASAWTRQYLSASKEQKVYLKFMAARLYFDTGNMVARQFLEGLAQGDPDDVTNEKLYPGYKMMKEGMAQ